jgi:hypothetical protein
MKHRYFECGGERWRVSVASVPMAPAGRRQLSIEQGRTRLYFYSDTGVMRSVLYPSDRRLTDDDVDGISDETLCGLVGSPLAVEMGRLSVIHQAGSVP